MEEWETHVCMPTIAYHWINAQISCIPLSPALSQRNNLSKTKRWPKELRVRKYIHIEFGVWVAKRAIPIIRTHTHSLTHSALLAMQTPNNHVVEKSACRKLWFCCVNSACQRKSNNTAHKHICVHANKWECESERASERASKRASSLSLSRSTLSDSLFLSAQFTLLKWYGEPKIANVTEIYSSCLATDELWLLCDIALVVRSHFHSSFLCITSGDIE